MNIRPQIWRRVIVHRSLLLADLHQIIQISVGWSNSHLYSFSIENKEYGTSENEFGPTYMEDILEDKEFRLQDLIPRKEKYSFSYTYDFGDYWQHKIVVEKFLAADEVSSTYPACTKAKRACPPEDCGGPWGYQHLIEALNDKNHPAHKEMKEWLDRDLSPEHVDLDEINYFLKERFEK